MIRGKYAPLSRAVKMRLDAELLDTTWQCETVSDLAREMCRRLGVSERDHTRVLQYMYRMRALQKVCVHVRGRRYRRRRHAELVEAPAWIIDEPQLL